MKSKFFLILLLTGLSFGFSQQKDGNEQENPFTYLEMKGEFDLLVDFSMINPECASKNSNPYSVIIGTTVVGEYIERITVLVPCLSNQFMQGDLITIKPVKTPKKNIIYTVRTYTRDGEEVSEVFGAEFKAIWGEVAAVL